MNNHFNVTISADVLATLRTALVFELVRFNDKEICEQLSAALVALDNAKPAICAVEFSALQKSLTIAEWNTDSNHPDMGYVRLALSALEKVQPVL